MEDSQLVLLEKAPPSELPGRKPFFENDQLFRKFLLMLQAGNFMATACGALSIDVSSVTRALKRGEQEDAPENYRWFYLRVAQVRATHEASLVKTVKDAARNDPKWAMAMLEKQFPETWGARTQHGDGITLEVNLAFPGVEPGKSIPALVEAVEEAEVVDADQDQPA